MPNKPSDLKSFMSMLDKSSYVVLDTETTGLHDTAEIVQLAIVSSDGEIMLNTFVKPTTKILADATAVTGIDDDTVADAPTWAEIVPLVRTLLVNMRVITYGATFDRRLFHQSDRAAGLAETEWDGIAEWYCAMTAFAERFGAWNAYRGSYTWQKLVNAVTFYGLALESAHDALGDALMTLNVIEAMKKDKVCIELARHNTDKTTVR